MHIIRWDTVALVLAFSALFLRWAEWTRTAGIFSSLSVACSYLGHWTDRRPRRPGGPAPRPAPLRPGNPSTIAGDAS
jgi:hypothetical protein